MVQPHKPTIVVIAGPTAVGKTAVAVTLAQRLGGELIGADSVQIFRGFDIASAKPSLDELQGIPHHLIDALDPCEPIDAMGYASLADDVIAAAHQRGRLPIVVGGTGLWIRALLRGLVDLPRPDPAVRARLERQVEDGRIHQLYERLCQVDPLAAERIHPHDALRITRALEVFEQTGTPMGRLQREHALGAFRYRFVYVVLELPTPLLLERIETRTSAMLGRGLEDEVRRLLERYGPAPRAFGSIGYKQMLRFVQGSLPKADLHSAIVQATKRYARRQRTWFQSDPAVTYRVSPADLVDEAGLSRLERAMSAATDTTR